MNKAKWIWHPGSFELYHSMLLHNRRTTTRTYEGGVRKSVYYYPMWRIDSPQHNVILEKKATIDKPEVLKFYANTDTANMIVDGMAYRVGSEVALDVGEHTVCLQGFKKDGFPAFYIEGDTFKTDRTYIVGGADDKRGRHAGYSDYYTDPSDNPEIFKFSYKKMHPVSKKDINGGTLFDFGKEVFGKITLENLDGKERFIALGESIEEALDVEYCQIGLNASGKSFVSDPVAFRYIFVPELTEVQASLDFEYLPLENKGAFKCDNELVNRLWDVCAYTMLLNSREGFFDGIKRDRWVWAGDAYQTNFVNYYLANDPDIVRRTIRILRGRDPITKHINTICDYTFLWIASVWDYYLHSGDSDFVKDIYPEILDMWAFIEPRLDDDGMYKRQPDDWVFIDWSTFDSNGPMCAEQMLLARAYECTAKYATLVGDSAWEKHASERFEYIATEVNKHYWNEEKGAFIDDYKSGKNNVTRHANIFAILFDYTSEERKERIIKNVIFNDKITKITTPYFEFYELDAMCQIGSYEYMTNMLDSYWGEMLRLGATTIWEEFDPTKKGIEHYEMYGGKYEKSLCHAWGASPIYLLGKYALGVKPTSAGYKTYEVKPNLMTFGKIEGIVPTPCGNVFVSFDGGKCEVVSEIDGGTLVLRDKKYPIIKGEKLTVNL
ncbi:MAG: alpha-rhamnosidase [Clostridia bacterium]|nr:alpha-rhamnosidase [Clostridia bacterium]